MKDDNAIVLPGEALGIEEEFLSSKNTFVDEGVIRSAAFGKIIKENGKIEVKPLKSISKIQNNMVIIGKITDNVGSVVFVKIDDIKIENEEYLALFDGKIIMRRSHDNHQHKPCSIGDIILAKIIDLEEDTYILDIFEQNLGVVFSTCPFCGIPLIKNDYRFLVCTECKHKEQKQLSPFYMSFEQIVDYLEKENKRVLSNQSNRNKYNSANDRYNDNNEERRENRYNNRFRDRNRNFHNNSKFTHKHFDNRHK
ncbi:MAG: exosome complex RNA-binding protein Csl4 [Candidatus Marsarchaeota archaeon]|jgi:exosome complex component CSL4|nr:exosome complex RNA-binding protein Csl4 [Candidatus Marsarchaeota archaeon]